MKTQAVLQRLDVGFPIFNEMRMYFYRKPYLTILIAAAVVIVFEVFFFTQTVIAQPALVLAESSDFDNVLKIANVAWLILSAIAFVAGFVWYVIKGKSSEQQEATIKQLERSNSDLRGSNNDLRLEIGELRAEVKQIELENENLRKANLRLQGIHDTKG